MTQRIKSESPAAEAFYEWHFVFRGPHMRPVRMVLLKVMAWGEFPPPFVGHISWRDAWKNAR